MKYIAHAKEGLQNLYFAKLRSILALLGILVGTASVVAMVLGGEIATNEALKQFKSLGTDLLAFSINQMRDENGQENQFKSEPLSVGEVLKLKSADSKIVEVAPYTQIFQSIYYEGTQLNSMVLGVTETFADVLHIQLAKGRMVGMLDKYSLYCVIGNHLYTRMKEMMFQDPLGRQLQIGKNYFIIIGVADEWPENSFVYADINESILVPILTSMITSKYATINNVILRLAPNADIKTVEDKIMNTLSTTKTNQNISFKSAKELIAKMAKQSAILTVFLGLIASISLVVGGIGVMNIMLVSVMERRREIGIRLAVGATRQDIGGLFITEAVMLSIVGGGLGVLIGILIAYLISLSWHWQFTLFLWPPVAGFFVSVAVGIFFGFYPAYLASRLDPIEALRSE